MGFIGTLNCHFNSIFERNTVTNSRIIVYTLSVDIIHGDYIIG